MDDLLEFSSLDHLLGLTAPTPKLPQPEPQATLPLPGIGAPLDSMPQYQAFSEAQNDAVVKPPMRPVPSTPGDALDTIRQGLLRTESSGNYQAKNPNTSASGAYQWIRKTWNNYGGYPEARLAPRAVQEARINEDLARALKQFNGDPFRVIANHMLPAQANKPWLWTRPSYLKQGKQVVTIPPVAEYVSKVVRGTPYEKQFNAYMSAYLTK